MHKYEIRTDLAVEAQEIYRSRAQQAERETPGIAMSAEDVDGIKITRVRILDERGEQALGKPKGNYITIETKKLKTPDKDGARTCSRLLAKELRELISPKKEFTTLVAGLGNWNITPDSIGPKVIESLMVTRHLVMNIPDQIDQGVRPVCAIAPGVLGITGVETGEIIRGVVDRVKPDVVIAVDALASRKMDRVSTTLQIADTGISPGSGVGNKRKELSEQTLGIPVFAIGVPMVVEAATIASDTIDMALDALTKNTGKDAIFYEALRDMDRERKYQLISNVLCEDAADVMVTPKEVDSIADRVSKIIADGINLSMHDGFDFEDIAEYI